MVAEHLGQGPEIPAIDSGTVRRTPQEGQENEITPGVIESCGCLDALVYWIFKAASIPRRFWRLNINDRWDFQQKLLLQGSCAGKAAGRPVRCAASGAGRWCSGLEFNVKINSPVFARACAEKLLSFLI